ncbi:winged helix-turn-helix transcriptional regulator [Archangium violaceum]|uniref:winged helix-turn-helix transcriptional regulator n=1 Tax=Archangium violaceum TaxID=83451 RepID=UPI0023B7DC78|nr:helix-turn-helix domain-containing protein [Archangium violaceum]
MTRTHEKVGDSPEGKGVEVVSDAELADCVARAVKGTEEALSMLEGRWKMMILFHLFARPVLRFSELERAIPAISQKMLSQQLRELERDGIVRRTVHPQVPPKVEYALTDWGRSLCPVLDALLKWLESRGASPTG